MKRIYLNVLLLLALMIIMGLNWSVKVDHRRPNRLFLPNMMESVPFDAFDPNPYFPDQKTLQQPAPGTISRDLYSGWVALGVGNDLASAQLLKARFTADSLGAALAANLLTNPFTVDSVQVKEEGAYVYRDYCLPCHGPGGLGDGVVALRGFPPPPSLMAPNAVAMADGRLYHIITHGQGNMPGYAAQIRPLERWKAVFHIRELQNNAESTAKDVE